MPRGTVIQVRSVLQQVQGKARRMLKSLAQDIRAKESDLRLAERGKLVHRLRFRVDAHRSPPRFNIAPTQPYFVLKTRYENREAIPALGAW